MQDPNLIIIVSVDVPGMRYAISRYITEYKLKLFVHLKITVNDF